MKAKIRIAVPCLVALAVILFAACKGSNGRGPAAGTSGSTLGQVGEAKTEEPSAPKKKIMYRSTMSPNEVSDKPGKDSMGMDMVPFEVEESGTVTEVGGRIQVKICLLYTSPSPRDRQKSRMPSSA